MPKVKNFSSSATKVRSKNRKTKRPKPKKRPPRIFIKKGKIYVRISGKKYLLKDQNKYSKAELTEFILKNLSVRRKRRKKKGLTKREKQLNKQDLETYKEFERLNKTQSKKKGLVLPSAFSKSKDGKDALEKSFYNAMIKFSGKMPEDINITNRKPAAAAAPPSTALVSVAGTTPTFTDAEYRRIQAELGLTKSQLANSGRAGRFAMDLLAVEKKIKNKTKKKTDFLIPWKERLELKYGNPIDAKTNISMTDFLARIANSYPKGLADDDFYRDYSTMRSSLFEAPSSSSGPPPPPPGMGPPPPGMGPPPPRIGPPPPPAPPSKPYTGPATRSRTGGVMSLSDLLSGLTSGKSGLKKTEGKTEKKKEKEGPIGGLMGAIASSLSRRRVAITGESFDERLAREKKEKAEEEEKKNKSKIASMRDGLKNVVKDRKESPAIVDEKDPFEGEKEEQIAAGIIVDKAAKIYKGKGLSTSEINKMMSDVRGFIGTFPADFLKFLPKKLPKKFGFIMNLDKGHKKGSHWVAVWIDTTQDLSVEYYDSFGEEPTKLFLKQIKKLIDRLDINVYLKFKINKIKEQHTSTSNCGWFAMRFIMDRSRGSPFKECTGYDNSTQQENDIENFKSKFSYI